MDAVSIIPTAASDIPNVINFVNASWVRTYTPFLGEQKASALATSKHSRDLILGEIGKNNAVSWIAKLDNGDVIGHVGGFEKQNGTMFIDRFHVAPEWHGKGVAKQLDEAVSEDAAQKGYQQLELTVLEDNDRAIAFYSKAGFECDESRSPTEGLGPCNALTLVKTLNRDT